MKHFKFLRGNSCFVAIMMLVVYCATAFGQTSRYEITRYKDSTGRDEPYSGASSWEFSGNNLIWHLLGEASKINRTVFDKQRATFWKSIANLYAI